MYSLLLNSERGLRACPLADNLARVPALPPDIELGALLQRIGELHQLVQNSSVIPEFMPNLIAGHIYEMTDCVKRVVQLAKEGPTGSITKEFIAASLLRVLEGCHNSGIDHSSELASTDNAYPLGFSSSPSLCLTLASAVLSIDPSQLHTLSRLVEGGPKSDDSTGIGPSSPNFRLVRHVFEHRIPNLDKELSSASSSDLERLSVYLFTAEQGDPVIVDRLLGLTLRHGLAEQSTRTVIPSVVGISRRGVAWRYESTLIELATKHPGTYQAVLVALANSSNQGFLNAGWIGERVRSFDSIETSSMSEDFLSCLALRRMASSNNEGAVEAIDEIKCSLGLAEFETQSPTIEDIKDRDSYLAALLSWPMSALSTLVPASLGSMLLAFGVDPIIFSEPADDDSVSVDSPLEDQDNPAMLTEKLHGWLDGNGGGPLQLSWLTEQSISPILLDDEVSEQKKVLILRVVSQLPQTSELSVSLACKVIQSLNWRDDFTNAESRLIKVALEALAQRGPLSVPALADIAFLAGKHTAYLPHCLDTIAAVGSGALPLLRSWATSSRIEQRMIALRLLGRMNPELNAEQLIEIGTEFLNSKSQMVRLRAVNCMINLYKQAPSSEGIASMGVELKRIAQGYHLTDVVKLYWSHVRSLGVISGSFICAQEIIGSRWCKAEAKKLLMELHN